MRKKNEVFANRLPIIVFIFFTHDFITMIEVVNI